METLASQKQASLWILCVVLITTHGESCPPGALIHLASLRCYWLSEVTLSWFEARDSCRGIPGGDLASAHSLELQTFIYFSIPVETPRWVWLHGSEQQGPDHIEATVPLSPDWPAEDRGSQMLCNQMSLGNPGRWRETQCAERYLYLCEKKVTDSLPSTDSFLTGLIVMTGVYTNVQIHPLPSVPDVGQDIVEVQVFPGLWFSHAGQVMSIEMVVQPFQESSAARVQILRPYCKPHHHLVPPGCSSLLNPFSCCSAVPLCNTTGGCGAGQYWCHLLEACVPNTSPCSPYHSAAGDHGYALPPRYIALPPFYHLVADLSLRINPSSERRSMSVVLPEQVILVYPDDIVAIQHTRDSGTLLHCLNSEASLGSPWRQSYLSFRGPEWGGWLEGGLTSLPEGREWVDGVVCDLRMLYVDTLQRVPEDTSDYIPTKTTKGPTIEPPLTTFDLTAKFGVGVIHPLPDEQNQIPVQIGVPTLIVVKALFGEKAHSSWSQPVLKAGIPFLPSCPEGLVESCPGCGSRDAWFSSVTVVFPSLGVQILNISVMDAETIQSLTVEICGYEAVTALSVEPHGCLRMLVDRSESFTATVESGSAVKFTWVIDNLQEFAYEGESYSVMFKKPAEYKLQVTASNPVSSERKQVVIMADEAAPLAELKFQFVTEVVAVGAPHVYSVGVRADISLPVTFRWDFGDGNDIETRTKSAPCETITGLEETRDKQVFIQDSLNYSYSTSDDYILRVQVSNQYDNTEASMKIHVRSRLNSLLITPSTPVPLVKQSFYLEASVKPSDFAVSYIWDFGNGSKTVQAGHRKISHIFESAGVFNITVAASNTLTSMTAWLMLVVMEEISELMVDYFGPREAGFATDFRAKVASGTNLIWDFDLGDGSIQKNLTAGYISHIYRYPGKYKMEVMVCNSVSQARQSVFIEIYSLSVSGVLPTECVMSQTDIQFRAVVNGNASFLTFHWLFGEDLQINVVTGLSTVRHTFQDDGLFPVNLTVFSSVSSVSFSTSICVESPIDNVVLQMKKNVAAVGEEVCVTVMVFPEQTTDYQFLWFSNSPGGAALPGKTEKCFIFRQEGVEEVSVIVSNKVSNKTTKAWFTVQKPVSELSIAHEKPGDMLLINRPVSFWVETCLGSNVSVIWEFGDGSPMKQMQNVSHVFTSTGQFTVTAIAFNMVNQRSVNLTVIVVLPVSDLSLHTSQTYAVAGEETLITAVYSDISHANFSWIVEGVTLTKEGTSQFRFIFPKPGAYQVKVIAHASLRRNEAAISIEVYERIEGVQIQHQGLVDSKYVPTHKKILFTVSATKGSNVTYQWLCTQSKVIQQTTGNGQLFYVTAESPGNISVQLKASNVLGQATSSISFVAEESITSAHIVTQANIVALGKAVNISVIVPVGSGLKYFWYVNTSPPPLQTPLPFLLHTFSSGGHCVVTVSVQNCVSQSNDTKHFLVQEEIQDLDFKIDNKNRPFYFSTSAEVSLHGFVHQGSDLHWEWTVRTDLKDLFTSTNQTLISTFPQAGIIQVHLNVSNDINWQMVSHSVTVQDTIKGLQLNISKSPLCTNEKVTLVPLITKGTNVSFIIILQNKDWIQREDIFEGQFTTSSLPVGRNLITLKAWNHVSNVEISSTILVVERVQGLRLVNCCSGALVALKGYQFKAEVQTGFMVNYTWIFRSDASVHTLLSGEEVSFTPSGSGLLTVTIQASNGVCSQMINNTVMVEMAVKEVQLMCDSEKTFVGHAVSFSLGAIEGSNAKYLWDFGDSSEILETDLGAVSHTYSFTGKYNVVVKAFNNVSQVSTELVLTVEELQCSSPQVFPVQSPSTIFRSQPSFFEATVDINCSVYKTNYRWEIFRNLYRTNDSKDFSADKVYQDDTASTLLLLPKHSLEVGCYRLVFTVSFQGTPLLVQRKISITVVHSPLVAVIKGGSHRLWSSHSDLVLDGSPSYDPDAEPGQEDTLRYHFTCIMVNSTECPFVKQPIGSISSRVTILSTQLQPDTIYIFTLTVHKNERSTSVNHTVTLIEDLVLPMSAECISCSVVSTTHHISYTTPVSLSGHCEQCEDQTEYKWRAVDQTGQPLQLDEVTTSTERYSPNLVIRVGVLQPGRCYSFALHAFQPGTGRWGNTSLTIQPNSPPHGGTCDLIPESDVRLLETVVTYNCSGWRDDESSSVQLIYTFQVSSCQPISSICPVLTLYRGTRSTFSSLVPVGSPGHQQNMSVIIVSLLVEDNMGAKVTALDRTLIVESPVGDDVAGEWLKHKSQTELWSLVQHGNPQEIVPYSIALISKLNQMESGWTDTQLADRRKIRENVTQALASLPVSSLGDVDQISSALSQSTAVRGELASHCCQEKVLEAVGKMIYVLKELTSPAVSPAVNTGRNILNILGSTLAPLSESVNASSSLSSYSSTLQAASVTALSAVGHAGALMRSLMCSRVPGEAPLSLSTDYITVVGFQGNPSDLICAHQHHVGTSSTDGSPSGWCQFVIPNSLTAHLSARSPEVVQVLIGTDEELKSNTLLAAADPLISTNLIAMELTTPQGQPIPIQDLDPEQAIRVTLPNKYPVDLPEEGRGGRESKTGNGTCLTVKVPSKGELHFTVKALEDLAKNAGLYISFNFTLAPGATPVSLGHVKIEVSSAVPETNASQDSLVREWVLALSALASSSEETVFLSPLLNETDRPFSVNLTSSLEDGGPVHVSVCVFSSQCWYYSLKERRWSSEGLRPVEGSTLRSAHCLTQHLTMFGASLFVHPGAVVLLPPSGGPVRNVVVGIVCAVLVLIHLLVGLIAHKLDHLDSLRLSQVPLCGRSGLYHYRVLVKTDWRPGAGTTAHVGINLYGMSKSGSRHLQRDGAFQRGNLDQFHVETDDKLGEVWKIRLWHDNTGLDPSWYVQHVVVYDLQTDYMFFFLVNDWLSVENHKDGTVEKEVLASCPEELTQFRRVLVSQLMFGLMERHLWLSVWERPIHSHFTRGQRVACSGVLLHLYLALATLWYGAVGSEERRGPASAYVMFNAETVAVGMMIAVLAFPLQCFMSFLFRKAQSQVTLDMSVPPSPLCHSVEMDVYLSHSELSGPSFLSLADSSGPVRDSPSSLLESKGLDSSILNFWAATGLAPLTDAAHQDDGVVAWPSSDSLLNPSIKTTKTPKHGPTHQLRRRKALMQLQLASPIPPISPTVLQSSSCTSSPSEDIFDSHWCPFKPSRKPLHKNLDLSQVKNPNLTTLLTLSEEDLLMSIAAAAEDTGDTNNSFTDSGRDSPRTMSSFSTTQSVSCSNWSELSEEKSLFGAEATKSDVPFYPVLDEAEIYRCPSVLTIDSVASTFLPSPSPDSKRTPSTTRIGVARSRPSWLLPPWTLRVLYPLVAVLLGACLTAMGLYGSFFSRKVVLMWLASALSAFLTSALLLEPLKVCAQALIYALLWRPVDPEVEEQLARETSVIRTLGEQSGKVRPPCGYGLLQAKEEARKVRTLKSLMRHCTCQLLFLLVVLLVNYQHGVEQRQGRLLHAAVRQRLHTAPPGFPNLTSLTNLSETEQWISHTLMSHLHQNPTLCLMGSPQLRYTHPSGSVAADLQRNKSETQRLLTDLHAAASTKTQVETMSLDFTQYHRESGLFLCVSVRLVWSQALRFTPFLSIHPVLIPTSFSGPDLQSALMVLLLISALVILFGEICSMMSERAQYPCQPHHWIQLLLALLALATSILQLCFLSVSYSCLSKLRSEPDSFVNFHRAAYFTEKSSQYAAVLLTLLVLKLLGTLRFVRRWVLLGRVLQRAWRELQAVAVLTLLLLLLNSHLGNMLFSHSVEDFASIHQSSTSVLSILRGRTVLQRLCRIHPVLGPVYGLLLLGGCVWLFARLCGAVFISTYRAKQTEPFHPAIEPQDYEMVEFFIKRLKLWMGLTKAKQFRHRVKFEGMDVPPSRSSLQESRLSTVSSTLSSSHSPSLSSSFSPPGSLCRALSAGSDDSSVSEPAFEVQPYLDSLTPSVDALLTRFDRVNQITEVIQDLEVKLLEAQTRRRKHWMSNREEGEGRFEELVKPYEVDDKRVPAEVRQRKTGLFHPRSRISLPSSFPFSPSSLQSSAVSIRIFPRIRSSYSESESIQHQQSNNTEATKPAAGHSGLCAGSPGSSSFPRRRAWHSGSSHSADAAQRALHIPGVAPYRPGEENSHFKSARPRSEEGERRHISDGFPVKKKAWIAEGPEIE